MENELLFVVVATFRERVSEREKERKDPGSP